VFVQIRNSWWESDDFQLWRYSCGSPVTLKVVGTICLHARLVADRYVDEESGEPTSRHVDDSVVTFNFCLGVGHFEGMFVVCVLCF
jgi:hypothetical protein